MQLRQPLLEEDKKTDEAPASSYKNIVLKTINSYAVILEMPFALFMENDVTQGIKDIAIDIRPTIAGSSALNVAGHTTASVVSIADLIRSILWVNVPEDTAAILASKQEQDGRGTRVMQWIARATYVISSLPELIAITELFPNTKTVKITLSVLGIPFVIAPGVSYYEMLTSKKIVEHCEKLPQLPYALFEAFKKDPLSTLETAFVISTLAIMRGVTTGGILSEWSQSIFKIPALPVLEPITIGTTGLVTLLSRSLSTINAHHHPYYELLTTNDIAGVQLSFWEKLFERVMAALRAGPIGVLLFNRYGSESGLAGALVGAATYFLFELNYNVRNKTKIRQTALAAKKVRGELPLEDEKRTEAEQLFDEIAERYEGPWLERTVGLINLVASLGRLALNYELGERMLSAIGIVATVLEKICATLLIAIPPLEGDANFAKEELKTNLKYWLTKLYMHRQQPLNDDKYTFWRLKKEYPIKYLEQFLPQPLTQIKTETPYEVSVHVVPSASAL